MDSSKPNDFRAIREQTRADFYALASGYVLREKRKPSVWATEERRLAAGGPLAIGEDIRYSHEVMPHARQPMDDADNQDVNILVLWMGRRMGKTESVCANIIGRNVTDWPVNMISMWPVEDSANRFSRDVIETTIEATPALRTRFVQAKSRDSGRTIQYKRFHGGSLIINYSGSKSQTKGMAAGAVFAHEVDAYPADVQGEGDPIAKLFGRAEGFEAIKVIESTGTFAAEIAPDGTKVYKSNIEKWYDRSDQQKWFCPCRKCGAEQWLKWDQIRELAKKSGQTWFYICEKCDVSHDEKQWRRMVGDGKWKPTAPFVAGIRGYWINGFNSLLPKGKGYSSKLAQFAIEGRRAEKGTPEERRVWINEVKCELVAETEAVAPPSYQSILDNREDYATDERVVVPAKGLVLTTMTDLHGDRLEVEWRAWAKNEESWGIQHAVLYGDTQRAEVWDQWTKHLQTQWQHELGGKIGMSLAFVDAGWRTDPALATLRRLQTVNIPGVSGKVRLSKGVGEYRAVVFRRWATIKDNAKGVHIGTWAAKSLLYERLHWHSSKKEDRPAAGFVHFGKSYSDDFIRQIVSEKAVMKILNGYEVETFKNPEGARNEGLDLLVGNLAAFRYGQERHSWHWEGLETKAKEKMETPVEVKKPVIAQQRAPSVLSRLRPW